MDRSFDPGGFPAGEYYLIGDLQELVGLEPKTIRYYEHAGLIKPRRIGRYRVYDSKDTERLKVIKFLRRFDLSLKLIRALFRRHGAMGVGSLPDEARQEVLKRLKERRDEIESLEKLV